MRFVNDAMSSLVHAQLDLMTGKSHIINSKDDQV